MNDSVTIVLALLGVVTATALAVLGAVPLLADALIGAGVGAIAGKVVQARLERRVRELTGPRVRQLDVAWTLGGIAGALLLNALVALAEALL